MRNSEVAGVQKESSVQEKHAGESNQADASGHKATEGLSVNAQGKQSEIDEAATSGSTSDLDEPGVEGDPAKQKP